MLETSISCLVKVICGAASIVSFQFLVLENVTPGNRKFYCQIYEVLNFTDAKNRST